VPERFERIKQFEKILFLVLWFYFNLCLAIRFEN
jgi:hypothetical protein